QSTNLMSNLTLGQASCLVLGWEPTPSNRKKPKKTFQDMPVGVTYKQGDNPMEPCAMGKDIIARNPFKYRTYPPTPSSSPRLSPTSAPASTSISVPVDDEGSSSMYMLNYSKSAIIRLLKLIFDQEDPGNSELFQLQHLSNAEVYSILHEQLPKLDKVYNVRQIALLLNQYKEHFGELRRQRQKGLNKEVRSLYVLKESARGKNSPDFRRHVQHESGWANIGYVRKSITNESNHTKVRLLQMMMLRLKNRCFVAKVFVSTNCNSSSALVKRDSRNAGSGFDLGDGDAQGMFEFIAMSTKKVRLCVIDYAGLTNNPSDLKSTLE
ncbi:hypothetical protein K492DRAFT_138863, partial [Lichtheimia hyalospora FSU 10163]